MLPCTSRRRPVPEAEVSRRRRPASRCLHAALLGPGGRNAFPSSSSSGPPRRGGRSARALCGGEGPSPTASSSRSRANGTSLQLRANLSSEVRDGRGADRRRAYGRGLRREHLHHGPVAEERGNGVTEPWWIAPHRGGDRRQPRTRHLRVPHAHRAEGDGTHAAALYGPESRGPPTACCSRLPISSSSCAREGVPSPSSANRDPVHPCADHLGVHTAIAAFRRHPRSAPGGP